MNKKILDDRLYIRINREDKLKLIEESIDSKVTLSEYVISKLMEKHDHSICGHMEIDIVWAIQTAILFYNHLHETTHNEALKEMYSDNIFKLTELISSVKCQ